MIQKRFLIAAIFALFFASCQKEVNNLTKEPEKFKEEGVFINVNKDFTDKEKPNSSKFAIKKPSSVEVIYQYGNFKTHATMKVRKHDYTNYQEWFMVDLETDFYDFRYWNSNFGFFYNWTEAGVKPFPLQNNYDNEYDYLVWKDKTSYVNIPGFHIPTHADLMKLGATLGNTNKISAFLALEETGLMRFYGTPTAPEGGYYSIDDPTNYNGQLNYTTMWVDLRQDGYASHYNNNQGCGIYAWFVEDYNNELHYFLTTIPNLRTRVILVRDLPANEW